MRIELESVKKINRILENEKQEFKKTININQNESEKAKELEFQINRRDKENEELKKEIELVLERFE